MLERERLIGSQILGLFRLRDCEMIAWRAFIFFREQIAGGILEVQNAGSLRHDWTRLQGSQRKLFQTIPKHRLVTRDGGTPRGHSVARIRERAAVGNAINGPDCSRLSGARIFAGDCRRVVTLPGVRSSVSDCGLRDDDGDCDKHDFPAKRSVRLRRPVNGDADANNNHRNVETEKTQQAAGAADIGKLLEKFVPCRRIEIQR